VNLKSKLPPRFQKFANLGIIPKIILTPVTFFILFLVMLIRPILIVQFYPVDWQIGHMLAITHANQLRNKNWNRKHKRKKITIYCFFGLVSSEYALTKIGQTIPVVRNHLAWNLNFYARQLPNTRIYYPEQTKIQHYEDLDPLINFTQEEKEEGRAFLGERIDKFVCLNVRDSAYNAHINKEFGVSAKNWTNRNSDINSYRNAAEFLADIGYTVFRMGSIVASSFDFDNPKIIDYATNGMRTEFLDFYLAHECHFAISTSSGWDEIPTLFRRPLLLVNHFDPLMTLSKNCLVHPKMLFDTKSGRLLSLSETIDMHQSGKTNQKRYSLQDFGIEVIDMSSEDLVEAVTEMAQRVEGTFVETPEQKEMQAKLKHILSTHPKLQPTPNYYPIKTEFASCFLSRYPNFLDGLD